MHLDYKVINSGSFWYTLAHINLNMQMLKADSVISVTITMQTNTHF